MRFTFTKEQEELRQEVRDFLKKELDRGTFKVTSNSLVAEGSRDFSLKMARKGWIGLAWPKEFWGQGRSFVDKMMVFQAIGQPGTYILFQINFYMIEFTGFNRRNFFHMFVFRLLNYTGNPVTIAKENSLEEPMDNTFDQVKAIIVDLLGVDEAKVKLEARFREDLEADSLDLVELIMKFEDVFSTEISDEEAQKITTVGDAVTFVAAQQAKK